MTSSLRQKHLLYSDLAKTLGAGLSVNRALETLGRHDPGKRRDQFLSAIRLGLGDGLGIASSLRTHGGDATSPLEVNLLEAAEHGGQLPEGCQHLADYFLLQADTLQKIRSGFAYPLLVLHVAVLLPPLHLLFTDSVTAYLKASLIPLLVLYVFLGLAWFGIRALMKAAATSASIDSLFGLIPWIGKCRRSLALSRFAKVLQISLLSGRRVSSSFAEACAASGSGRVLDASRRIVPQIEMGNEIGPLLEKEAIFPAEFAHSMATAEHVGALDKETGRWAQWFQEEGSRAAASAAEWFPRLLFVLIAAFAGWKIISFYLGYFSQIQSLM